MTTLKLNDGTTTCDMETINKHATGYYKTLRDSEHITMEYDLEREKDLQDLIDEATTRGSWRHAW